MRNPKPSAINPVVESTGKNTYRWTFSGSFEVSDMWVADGFDLTPARLQEILQSALESDLCHANCETELKTTSKIISAPDPISIRREQGFPGGR